MTVQIISITIALLIVIINCLLAGANFSEGKTAMAWLWLFSSLIWSLNIFCHIYGLIHI